MNRRERIRRFGLWPSVWRKLVHVQRPVFGYIRYRCLTLSADRAVRLSLPEQSDVSVRRVPLDDLAPLVDTTELRAKHFARAKAESHACIGVFASGELASFSFNTPRPTRIGDELRFVFPEGWIYHHMAITLPAWRGRRLHALQIPALARIFDAPGFKGIVTMVEPINSASLRSFGRLGFEERGTFTLLGPGRHARVVAAPGAGAFAISRSVPSGLRSADR